MSKRRKRLAGRMPRAATWWAVARARRALARFEPPYKLHIGCGGVRFDGWVNVDIEPGDAVDLVWDASRPFPIEDASCSLIYGEHFIEHLTVKQAGAFLSECRRLLAADGVIRIATPSLEYGVSKYCSDDWRDQEWLRLPEYDFIKTRAQMLNVAFRWWGHEWLYDSEELHRVLTEAGFTTIRDLRRGQSDVPDLRNRETRPDSHLVCEARN